MSWLKKNKEKVLPEIPDYTCDYPELKWKSPKGMAWNEYFWMSCYNYMIIYYGLRVMPMLTFWGLGLYFHFKDNFYLALAGAVIGILFFAQTLKAIQGHKSRVGCTLYNMMIMEKDDYLLFDAKEEK